MPRHKHNRMSLAEFKNWYFHWYWIPRYWHEINALWKELQNQYDWTDFGMNGSD